MAVMLFPKHTSGNSQANYSRHCSNIQHSVEFVSYQLQAGIVFSVVALALFYIVMVGVLQSNCLSLLQCLASDKYYIMT
jgi:hypothetical protein